jgi:hypothetical protein
MRKFVRRKKAKRKKERKKVRKRSWSTLSGRDHEEKKGKEEAGR